jgi:CRISPR system Cascade subunit CasE
MMATVYTLTRNDCKALQIKDAYGIHRAVYDLFPANTEGKRDFLFADIGGDYFARKILILSGRAPQAPLIGNIEVKEVPERFLEHTCYAFQIRLNPVKREKQSGKLVPVKGRENLVRWFITKSSAAGFTVDEACLQIDRIGIQEFEKQTGTVTQGKAVFKGKLTVTDRELFKRAFREGIGRGKGFGFGLLQIIPIDNNS